MKKLNLITLILIISLMLGGTAFAGSDYSQTTDPSHAAFGARPLGMGGAYVGLADDSNAIFMNPAGLAQLNNWEITSLSTQILERVDYKLLGGAMNYGPGTLGIGYIGVSAPGGLIRTGGLTEEGSMTHDSHLAIVSYGIDMSKLMDSGEEMAQILVGANLKYMIKSISGIDNAFGTGINADLGLIIKPKNSFYTFGAAMQNILQDGSFTWASGTKENMESKTKIGGTLKVLGEGSIYNNVSTDLILSVDADLSSSLGAPALFHIGAEWKPLTFIKVRAGIDQSPLSETEVCNNLTAGVGFDFSGFRFDYAYHADEALETNKTHYFSISYSPENRSKSETKEEIKSKPSRNWGYEEKLKAEKVEDKEETVKDEIDYIIIEPRGGKSSIW